MKDMCKYLGMSSWFILILVGLDYGLRAVGQPFILSSNVVMNNMQLVQYLVLASALYSLYGFVMVAQGNSAFGGKRGRK